jgi:hypothetical protein
VAVPFELEVTALATEVEDSPFDSGFAFGVGIMKVASSIGLDGDYRN